MSAYHVFDNAPLGSLIRYSDGTPKPPARFSKKLAAWQRRNGVGRLVRKEPARERPTYASPPSITLHEGDFLGGAIILVTIMRTHALDSDLNFEIVERPRIGMVRVIQPHWARDMLAYRMAVREYCYFADWRTRGPRARFFGHVDTCGDDIMMKARATILREIADGHWS